MRFGFQIGHHMKGLTKQLLESEGPKSVILSPRNSQKSKTRSPQETLIKTAEELRPYVSELLIDPQLFRWDRPSKNITGFDYWKSCNDNLRSNIDAVTADLARLNIECETSAFILPSEVADSLDEEWHKLQTSAIEAATKSGFDGRIIPTIALSADIVKNRDAIETVVDEVCSWNVSEVYLLCEQPSNSYLVDEPLWLLNIMLLIAYLKRNGVSTNLGYSNHQMLSVGIAGCDTIYSGNFLKTRTFKGQNFGAEEDAGPSRRATWYYAPKLFSEFKVPTLDLAYQQGLMSLITHPNDVDTYSAALFNDGLPSNTAYNESKSFAHYLNALSKQVETFTQSTYLDTINKYQAEMNAAEKTLDVLREQGIFDMNRSFMDAFQANNQAVSAFDKTMGNQMAWEWNEFK